MRARPWTLHVMSAMACLYKPRFFAEAPQLICRRPGPEGLGRVQVTSRPLFDTSTISGQCLPCAPLWNSYPTGICPYRLAVPYLITPNFPPSSVGPMAILPVLLRSERFQMATALFKLLGALPDNNLLQHGNFYRSLLRNLGLLAAFLHIDNKICHSGSLEIRRYLQQPNAVYRNVGLDPLT